MRERVAAEHRNVAYFFGEDAYSLDRAVVALAVELGGGDGALEIWRVAGDDERAPDDSPERAAGSAAGRRRIRVLDQVEQRANAAPLFGGGTLVVIRQPSALVREAGSRTRLMELLRDVPTGNGVVLADVIGGGGRRAATNTLRDALLALGARVQEFPAMTRERMESWAETRAAELGFRFAPGAARLLVERVGGFVREGDVDRRRQTEVANAEIEKLALYRPGGSVTRADVGETVAEVAPGSMWRLLDEVAARRIATAAPLAERLATDGMAFPVLVSQLHRRIREVFTVAEMLEQGTRPGDLVRVLKVAPFRAQKLAEQARAWELRELEMALVGLLTLDLESKGIALDGRTVTMSDDRNMLALHAWLAERVARSRS